jgi:hypothetical protein
MLATQSDLEKEIQRAQEEVDRQEQSGQLNTASHEVLANLKRAAEPKKEKELKDNG